MALMFLIYLQYHNNTLKRDMKGHDFIFYLTKEKDTS